MSDQQPSPPPSECQHQDEHKSSEPPAVHVDEIITALSAEKDETHDVATTARNDHSSPSSALKASQIVFLVYHQKEPHLGSVWSYDPSLRFGPSFIDKVCVGVYSTREEADKAARIYWNSKIRGGPPEKDDCPLGGLFCKGVDSSVLSQRVYVETQELNPMRGPTMTAVDKAILKARGRK